MILYTLDTRLGFAIFTFLDPATDEDYHRYVEKIHEGLRTIPSHIPPVFMVADSSLLSPLVEHPSAPPDSRQRRIIANGTAVLPRADGLFCLVTGSRLIAGVITAINWVRPPAYAFKVCRDVQAAINWIHSKRDAPHLTCETLCGELGLQVSAQYAEPLRARAS